MSYILTPSKPIRSALTLLMMLQKFFRGDGEEAAMMRVHLKASIVESSETPAARININNIYTYACIYACNHLAMTRAK